MFRLVTGCSFGELPELRLIESNLLVSIAFDAQFNGIA